MYLGSRLKLNCAAHAGSAADVTGQKIKMKKSRRVSRVVTSAEESGQRY